MRKIALIALIVGAIAITPKAKANPLVQLAAEAPIVACKVLNSSYEARVIQGMYVPMYHPCSLGVVCGGIAAGAAYNFVMSDAIKKYSWLADAVLRSGVVACALTLPYVL